MRQTKEQDMKKMISVLVITLLSGVAFGNGMTELVQPRAEFKPVVSAIALSAEQARELAKARNEYLARKIQLEAEYEARLDMILAKPGADNS
jgi:hypothetical protein